MNLNMENRNDEWNSERNTTSNTSPCVKNVAKCWTWRELGTTPRHCSSNKSVLENMAEDRLVAKTPLSIRCYDLPGYPRSTFLMVFSPDGTKVASTHGNHNVYVTELASGKHVRILKGHPRTPWCIAFHPSHPQLIGSGCLGGQVRVWDLSGGSETWTIESETVIASIAFHPRDQLLVIATYNELYFWDWSQPAPFTKVSTNHINEKVRFVSFDPLGHKLLTGISLWSNPYPSASILNQQQMRNENNVPTYNAPAGPPDRPNTSTNTSEQPESESRNAQEFIVTSYQNLVQRYDSLVRNYHRLFLSRNQGANTTDRGTDPMEVDNQAGLSTNREGRYPLRLFDNRGDNIGGGGDADNALTSENRHLSLDDLSLGNSDNTDVSANDLQGAPSPGWINTDTHHAILARRLASRVIAFQGLTNSRRGEPSFRNFEQPMRGQLPNPFSVRGQSSNPELSTSNSGDQNRSMNIQNELRATLSRLYTEPLDIDEAELRRHHANTSNIEPRASTSSDSIQQPNNFMSETITQSLDIIRDILRDSGTRLLNLITDITTASENESRNLTRSQRETNLPQRLTETPPRPPENTNANNTTPRLSIFSPEVRRELFSSDSDTDSNPSLEVNIYSSANRPIQENTSTDNITVNTNDGSTNQPSAPSSRMVVNLNLDMDEPMNNEEVELLNNDRINIRVSNNRFRLRSNSTNDRTEATTPLTRTRSSSSRPDCSEPSTSRQSDSSEPQPGPSNEGRQDNSSEAFQKVKLGIAALERHTKTLNDLWRQRYRPSIRYLRSLWENLRREILLLHRIERNDVSRHYDILERCHFLTEMTRNILSSDSAEDASSDSRNSSSPTTEPTDHTRNTNSQMETNTESSSSNNQIATTSSSRDNNSQETNSTPSTSRGLRRAPSERRSQLQRRHASIIRNIRSRTSSSARRRAAYVVNDNRRVNAPYRFMNRHFRLINRRDSTQQIEIHLTRHEIRLRAMQILSIMFNIMMGCLEERELSNQIILMLRTLKRALAVTCLLLMCKPPQNGESRRRHNTEPSNANTNDRSIQSQSTTTSNTETATIGDMPTSPSSSTSDSHTNDSTNNDILNNNEPILPTQVMPSTSSQTDSAVRESEEEAQKLNSVSPNESSESSPPPKWSSRLAIQISAANRNNTTTARKRKELYNEIKRLKALHKSNPVKHPFIRRFRIPPLTSHRIPNPRVQISKKQNKQQESRNISSNEPVAGPSGTQSNPNDTSADSYNRRNSRTYFMRFAEMHARLRNVARNRYRIRLYTPRVREMFDVQSVYNEEAASTPPPTTNNSEITSGQLLVRTFRRLLAVRNIPPPAASNPSENRNPFDAILNNVAVPLVQVNDVPVASEGQVNVGNAESPSIQQEYFQPIIHAPNALLVEEAPLGAVGMGSVWEAGLGSMSVVAESLTAAPVHRVQAWDFTCGVIPDISDSNKNVVVRRCKIHNDASIDVSLDGKLLVALLPAHRMRNVTHRLGVYSLDWRNLGDCLHTAILEQNAVSVALSPCGKHLAVGLGTRRVTLMPNTRNNVFGVVYKLTPNQLPVKENVNCSNLVLVRILEQDWEHGFTSLNCLRWAPHPGQGLVYANNTGQLIIMS